MPRTKAERKALLEEEEDEFCLKREDKTHCVHWWDGQSCCACGAGKVKLNLKLPCSSCGMYCGNDCGGFYQ